MNDLISRKGLLNKINAYVCGSQDKEFICKLIAEMPSVDAIEVVRCRDCKWWKKWARTCAWYSYSHIMIHADDYCSHGERKDDGKNL